MTASEIWEFDKQKNETAKLNGYDILIIWEDEFHKNPDLVIKQCKDFIYEKNT